MRSVGPLDQLRALLPSDQILTEDLGRYAVDGVSPAAVLLPQSVEEVSAGLRLAAERLLAVIPWGSGLHMDLGNRPAAFDIALDLSRLNAVVDYSPEDLVVSVQAGISLGGLDRRLAERGQFLALDTPLAGAATVGGALSAGLPAPSRLRFGTARDLVIGLTCVLSSGEIVHSGGRVVKNVAGYDLNKLYLGALGTLGVIVEAAFKLHPRPPVRAAVIAGFVDCAATCAAALTIVNSPLGAVAVEIAGPPLAQELAERVAAPDGWLLAVFLAGLPAAVERQRRDVPALLRDAAATAALDTDAQELLYLGLRDAGRAPERHAALILRCAVLPSEVAAAVERLQQAGTLGSAQVVASPVSGSLRLLWFRPPADAPAVIGSVRRSIAGMGGNVVVERCSDELKAQLDVWGLEGTDVELMRAMKTAYDPANILSPGRILPER
jgi:glycolate oxidase FAD binding subunit